MILSAFLGLLLLLGLGLPVAAALILLGLSLDYGYSWLPTWLAIGEQAWGVSTDFILFAVPLYVLLGELLLRAGISGRMYDAMAQWLSWLPGGLMHANIGTATLFAAVSGSSLATAATIGTVANPQIARFGYNERLFLGSVAAGGTLGILIPPSIALIVYGVLTETSIPRLYLAGFVPGLMLAAAFMLTVVLACAVVPGFGGRRFETSWRARLALLPDLLPPTLIFLVVIGAIYAGWATATESAALGVVMALALSAARGRLTLIVLRDAIEGTMKTTAMIMAIMVAAYFLNLVLTAIGLAGALTDLVTGAGLGPTETILLVVAFYLVLGMFMETLSMMIATVPIVAPVVFAQGADPVWFGILVVLLMETAVLTPPVGFNLFVVQGTRSHGDIRDVMIGAAPFVVALLAMIALVIAFPGIVLWLPQSIG